MSLNIGWFVVLASFMINAIADGVINSFGLFHQAISQHFDADEDEVSMVISLMTTITYCIGPIAAALTTKFDCRIVTIVGAICASMGLFLSIFAPNIYCLWATMGVMSGSGLGLIYLPSVVVVATHFETKRATAIGIALSGSGFGCMYISPAIEYLFERLNWKDAILMIAGFVFLGISLFAILFSAPPSVESSNLKNEYQIEVTFENKTNKSYNNQRQDGQSRFRYRKDQTRDEVYQDKRKMISEKISEIKIDFSLLGNHVFVIFAISQFVTFVGKLVPLVFLKDQMEQLDFTSWEKSFLTWIMITSSTVGRLVFGPITDHWFQRNRLWLYIHSVVQTGLIIVCNPWIESYKVMALFWCLYGVSAGTMVSLTSVILTDLLGVAQLANAFGFALFFQGVAAAAGPWLIQLIGDLYDDYYAMVSYIFGAIVMLSGVALVSLVGTINRRNKIKNLSSFDRHNL